MSRLLLVPVGNAPRDFLERLAWRLSTVFPHRAELLEVPLDPSPAHDAERGQFHSTRILWMLRELSGSRDGDRVLGVTEGDLFVPIFTFVFGEAMISGPSAVISSHRLSPSFYGLPEDRELEFERCLTESMHELGHTFGLHHCLAADCVMRASTNADDVDLKPAAFCEDCRKELPQ